MRNKQIKKLTWKYFIERKVIEIILIFILISSITIIPYYIGLQFRGDSVCVWYSNNLTDSKERSSDLENCMGVVEKKSITDIWGSGIIVIIGFLILLVCLGFFLYLFYLAIRDWIKSNWRKAKQKAKEELKVRKKK